MSKHLINDIVEKILTAHEIRFMRGPFNGEVYFNIDFRLEFDIPVDLLVDVLTKAELVEARTAFIEKLENPTAFMNDDYISTLRLPEALKLRFETEDEEELSEKLVKHPTSKYAKQILSATNIKYIGKWFHRHVLLDVGQSDWLSVPFPQLMRILSDDDFVDARDVFIEKLSNPVTLIDDEYIETLDLPKELLLKAKMTAIAACGN